MMDKNEEYLMQKVKKLNKLQRAYAGLVNSKFVNIRGNKRCAYCNNVILSGQRALTSSMPIDKKYNINFAQAYHNNCIRNCRFVPVRQWMHLNCAANVMQDASHIGVNDQWYKHMNFDDIDLAEVSDEEALEIISYFHGKGEISNSEYQIMEDAYINSIALRDAVGIGQE